MREPIIAGVGASPVGRSALPGRDLFSVAIEEAFADLPAPAELVDAVYVVTKTDLLLRYLDYMRPVALVNSRREQTVKLLGNLHV